jgi:drug/metabolite transporter (DMT)-like permease
MNPTRSFQGEIVLLSAAFIWGTAFVFQSIAMDFMLPLTFVWLRTLLATSILGIFLLLRARMNPRFNIRTLGTIKGYQGALLAGLFTGFAMITQQIGIVDSTAAKAGFLTALYLLLVPIIYLLFGKKVTWLQWGAIALGIAGVFYLSTEGRFDEGLTESDLLIMSCAVFYALQIITIDFRGQFIDPIMFSFIQFAVAFLLSFIVSIFVEGFDTSFINHPEALGALFYVGAISGVLGYTFQIIGQNLFKNPTVASLLMSFEAVFALVMGYVLLGETLSWMEGLGAGLMLLAITLTHFKQPQKLIAAKA